MVEELIKYESELKSSYDVISAADDFFDQCDPCNVTPMEEEYGLQKELC